MVIAMFLWQSIQIILQGICLKNMMRYMLYDDMGHIPKRVFPLGFYPESIASQVRFGNNHFAVIPLNEEPFNIALDNAKLIYVAAHGANGCAAAAAAAALPPRRRRPPRSCPPA